jgi:AmmeMemoRadiSam system protein A
LSSETTPLVRNAPSRLELPQGVFVTLKIHGELRGCIGHIPPDFPLGRAVGSMAIQSAFNDPRFAPLKASELAQVKIEISALTPMKDIKGPEEIVVGRDGVVIAKEGRSAVFLPQVAPENNWGRNELLENLCRKAGLSSDAWKSGAKFYVFQADVFDESHFR